MSWALASAITRSKKSSSTHLAVGFDGNPITSILGLGMSSPIARSSSTMKSASAVERGEHQMREAFLGSDGDDRFRIRIECDAVAALVPAADRAAQSRNSL